LDPAAVKQRSRALAEALAREALESKGENVRVLDVSELLYITDFFLIVTAQSARQTRAIAEALRAKAKEISGRSGREEGDSRSSWVLCDFDVVVAHVLTAESREFYALDELWSDAEEITFAA
jgi:ribosome-associated protein